MISRNTDMKRLTLLIIVLFTIISGILFAQNENQNWDWQWGKSSEISNAFRSLGIRTDFNNDFYSYYWYIDSITIGDTSFQHYGGFPNYQDFNLAIIKNHSNGEFIEAIDIYTPQKEMISMVDVEIDQESNIFVYGTFRDTVFINNNLVTAKDEPRNIFLIKLSNDFQFLWGKTIYSSAQDDCGGLVISKDNSIYLSAKHHTYGNDTVTRIVNYLDQDSAIIGHGLNSLLKIDSDGNLLWRREIRDLPIGEASTRNTIFGEDDHIYVVGESSNSLIIEGDTLYNPNYPNYGYSQYIVQYDEDGNKHNAFFIDIDHFSIYYWNFVVNDSSNYYISGILWQTVVFGSDTIEITGDSLGSIIAKMDSSFHPIWYEHVITKNQVFPRFLINLFDDSLAFATSTTGVFTFAGVNFFFGNKEEVILGLFNPTGELISYQVTQATNGLNIFKFWIDNCGNYVINGHYSGIAYFGNDTIHTVLPYERYNAKNFRYKPQPLDIPNDTIGCEELTLFGPEGYLYYKWNDELLNQNWFLVTNTGTINLKVANEDGCWFEGEINVTIFPEIQLSLGEDTTIYLTDTLELNTYGTCEFYLWSTGDTTSALTIPASDLQIGNNQIWLKVNNGPCFASDTINVIVIDNSVIEELYKHTVLIYPNPANNRLNIINNSNAIIESVCVYNLTGQKIVNTKPLNNSIDILKLQTGMYIIELVSNQWKVRRKLIIK